MLQTIDLARFPIAKPATALADSALGSPAFGIRHAHAPAGAVESDGARRAKPEAVNWERHRSAAGQGGRFRQGGA